MNTTHSTRRRVVIISLVAFIAALLGASTLGCMQSKQIEVRSADSDSVETTAPTTQTVVAEPTTKVTATLAEDCRVRLTVVNPSKAEVGLTITYEGGAVPETEQTQVPALSTWDLTLVRPFVITALSVQETHATGELPAAFTYAPDYSGCSTPPPVIQPDSGSVGDSQTLTRQAPPTEAPAG